MRLVAFHKRLNNKEMKAERCCMKRLNTILNTIMGAFAGVFIGYTIYTVWDFKSHPGLYALTSAPWYSSILVHGAVTLAVLVICVVIKVVLKRKS